jgi:hypothetical protein
MSGLDGLGWPTDDLPKTNMNNNTPTYAMLADMRDRALITKRELTTITEQRDKAQSELDRGLKENQELWASNAELTEQRDRLAESLRKCREDSVELLGEREWWQNEPRCDYDKRYQETRDNVTKADEALQSLTPKP